MGTWHGGYIYRGDLALVGQNRRIMAARPDPHRPDYRNIGSVAEAPCGTTTAYRRHRRHGEPACEPCKAAERLRREQRLAGI